MALQDTGSPMLYLSAFFVTIATILGTGILVRDSSWLAALPLELPSRWGTQSSFLAAVSQRHRLFPCVTRALCFTGTASYTS
jgi:hypothetical protein